MIVVGVMFDWSQTVTLQEGTLNTQVVMVQSMITNPLQRFTVICASLKIYSAIKIKEYYMSYANKSHAHRDDKNDYDRRDTRKCVKDELNYLTEHAQEIALKECKIRVEMARID